MPVEMERVSRSLRTSYSLEAELLLVALVLFAWQAIRIPLEGPVDVSLAHAASVLRLEGALSIDGESWVVRATSEADLTSALEWLYRNIHLPVLFGFVAAVRLLAPDRYPRLRTTYVVSFVPAVLIIGLYPLAPPHWLPQLGLGGAPTEHELTAGGALLHNSTAAAASQHFGFALFVAAASIWLFPRALLAWATLAYPALVFVVILGTGNHYVLDCLVGAATFAFAWCVAGLVHGRAGAAPARGQAGGALGVALGYALVTWGFVSLDATSPWAAWERNLPDALVLAAGIALVVAPRVGAREPLPESTQ
jgi:hypothetical protein